MLDRKQKRSVLLIALGALMLRAIPVGIGRLFFVIHNVSTNDILVFIIFPTIAMLSLLLLPFVAAKLFPALSSFALIWTRKPRTKIRWFFLLIFSIVALAVITALISKQTGYPIIKPLLFKDVTQLTLTFFVLQALCITILTPIAEEVFWRGYLQAQFSKCFGGKFGVFLQAFLFALAHCRPLLGFTHIFVFGLILGHWKRKIGSLLPIILVHAIMNGLWCLGHLPDQYEMSKKNISVDYVEEINKIGNTFPAKDNADADYQKVLKSYNRPSHRLYDFKLIRKNLWIDELTNEQRLALEQWITQNNAALVQFRLATQKPSYWPHYDGDLMLESDNFEQSSQLVELADALCWNARFDANNAETKQAFDDLACSYRFSNHLLSGPKPTLSFFCGMAIDRNVCRSAFMIIDKTVVNTEQLKSFQKQVQQVYQNSQSTLDFTWEKFTLYDIIQRLFTDDGDGNGHIPRIELKGQNVKMLKVLQRGISDEQIEVQNQSDRKTTTGLTDELFDFFNCVFPQTPAQLKNRNIDISSKIDEIMSDNILCPYVTNLKILHQYFYRNRAAQNALMATFAIFRYQKNNNSFPENLEILVLDGYLDRIPIDPFSNQPMIYKNRNGGFLLYSVGTDFDDDGGLHDDNWGKIDGDYVFWPVQYVNSDTKNYPKAISPRPKPVEGPHP